MFWHADNQQYTRLAQGFATAENIAGPYTFVKACRPLDTPSQDFGLFTDYKSGKSYALYSSGDGLDGRDTFIGAFNDELTQVVEVMHCFRKYDLEAPTIIQTDDSYFAIMSHKTGYRPNSTSSHDIFLDPQIIAYPVGLDVVAFRADSLRGPWSQPFFVAPPYTRTFSTQSGFSFRVEGSKKTSYLYMGDQVRRGPSSPIRVKHYFPYIELIV